MSWWTQPILKSRRKGTPEYEARQRRLQEGQDCNREDAPENEARQKRLQERRDRTRQRVMKRVPKPTDTPQIWIKRYDLTLQYQQAAPFMAEAGWTVASTSVKHVGSGLFKHTEQTVTWQHPGTAAGVQTPPPPTPTAGRCPHCGAPGGITGDRCAYCKVGVIA